VEMTEFLNTTDSVILTRYGKGVSFWKQDTRLGEHARFTFFGLC